MRIIEVDLWSNGQMIVFDETGMQAVELQGKFIEHLGKVLKLCDDRTEFYIGDWKGGRVKTTKAMLETMNKGFDEFIAGKIDETYDRGGRT